MKLKMKNMVTILYAVWAGVMLAVVLVYALCFPIEGRIQASIVATDGTGYRAVMAVPGTRVVVIFQHPEEAPEVEIYHENGCSYVKLEKEGTREGSLADSQGVRIFFETKESRLKQAIRIPDELVDWINEYSYTSSIEEENLGQISGEESHAYIYRYEMQADVNYFGIFSIGILVFMFILVLAVLSLLHFKKASWADNLQAYIQAKREEGIYEGKEREAENCFKRYFRRYQWYLSLVYILPIGLFLGMELLAGYFLVSIFVWLPIIALIVIVLAKRTMDAYREFLLPLTEKCDPDMAVLAHSYIYSYQWGIRAYVPYTYSMNIAEFMYYAGDVREALKFSEMIWNGSKGRRYREKSLWYLHYQHLRYECFVILQDKESVRTQREQIEAFINRKCKTKSKRLKGMIHSIQHSLYINDLLEAEEWQKCLEEIEKYEQEPEMKEPTVNGYFTEVLSEFQRYQCLKQLGDQDGALDCRRFVMDHGGGLVWKKILLKEREIS